MNDENNEFVNTEEPLEVSDEERQMILKSLEQAKRGEVKSQEEVERHIQQLIEEVKGSPLVIKEKEHTIRAVNEL